MTTAEAALTPIDLTVPALPSATTSALCATVRHGDACYNPSHVWAASALDERMSITFCCGNTQNDSSLSWCTQHGGFKTCLFVLKV
jgi:hypothetical protein